jgi:hypothetical protein
MWEQCITYKAPVLCVCMCPCLCVRDAISTEPLLWVIWSQGCTKKITKRPGEKEKEFSLSPSNDINGSVLSFYSAMSFVGLLYSICTRFWMIFANINADLAEEVQGSIIRSGKLEKSSDSSSWLHLVSVFTLLPTQDFRANRLRNRLSGPMFFSK